MKLLTFSHLQRLIGELGMPVFLRRVVEELEKDFRRWPEFQHSPRHAFHYPFGVMELMPCADDTYYAAKYVNGHPRNAAQGRLSIAALGLLADVPTGHPLMISDMTLLTAVRTAATAALAARYLARPDSRHVALIGTGAQAEFEILSLKEVLPVETVSYYDIDERSMAKFARNMQGEIALRPCDSIAQALEDADLWVTATAAKTHAGLISPDMLRPGVHLNALGGDCPGKTELQPAVLERCTVVVEYTEQSLVEGEIQNGSAEQIHAELWQVINGDRPGRESAQAITLFDSVGVAMEDFSILKLVYHLASERGIGEEISLLPEPSDAKDLYGTLME